MWQAGGEDVDEDGTMILNPEYVHWRKHEGAAGSAANDSEPSSGGPHPFPPIPSVSAVPIAFVEPAGPSTSSSIGAFSATGGGGGGGGPTSDSVVAGGENNNVEGGGGHVTISGGYGNDARGSGSTVAGGRHNEAVRFYIFNSRCIDFVCICRCN